MQAQMDRSSSHQLPWAELGPLTCDITETSLTPSVREPTLTLQIYCTGYLLDLGIKKEG